MYLILCHPHTALPLMVVSASIPLALPAHHNLFAHLNPYPAFIPLLSFFLSFSIIGFSGECSSRNQTQLTHTLAFSQCAPRNGQRRGSARLQTLSNVTSLILHCSGHSANAFQFQLSTRKPGDRSGKRAEHLKTTRRDVLSESSLGTLVSGRTAAL